MAPIDQKKRSLILRIITGSVLIVGVVFGIFYLSAKVFSMIALALTLIGARELALMFWPNKIIQRTIFLALVLFAAVAGLRYFSFAGVIAGGVWWVFVPVLLAQYVKNSGKLTFNIVAQNSIGMMIFVPFFLALSLLQMQFGPRYLLYILALVWANDIGAYFAGTFLGKTLLAPSISPKKTWEGVLGGLILGCGVIIYGGFLLNIHGIRWLLWITLNIVISLWSVIGDLFESMLKRLVQVKDSGNLLPGHGGIYDRIDSLTAAIPLFVLAVTLCGF